MTLPSAQAVVAMVGEGWAFADLMAMPARDFGFWFAEQEALSRFRAEQAKDPRG